MSHARSSAFNLIATRLSSKLSNVDLDSEEEICSILDDVQDMLELRHAKLENLQISHEDTEEKYREMTAETEEIKQKIEAMKRTIQLEEASQASLMEEAKRLKLDSTILAAIIAAFAALGLLPPDF